MITPQQYGAFITQTNTRIGQIYSEIGPGETHQIWTNNESMQGSFWSTAWTGKMPKARPWYGSRIVHEAAMQTYTVSPVPYELTVGIDKFIFDDSAVNGTSPFWRMLPDVAAQWRKQPEYELRDLLEGSGIWGSTAPQLGPDGLSYWNTAHPVDIYSPSTNWGGLFTAGTYNNDFTGGGATIGGTLIGGALSQASFASLYAYMSLIPGEDGEVLGVTPNVMMVPKTLEVSASFILKSAFMAQPTWGAFTPITGQVGTADNMLSRLGVNLVVNPFLRNTTRWYLMDCTHALKPMMWITREAAVQVPRMNPADPIVFDSHKYTWGGWDRVAPAWGFPWLSARSGP